MTTEGVLIVIAAIVSANVLVSISCAILVTKTVRPLMLALRKNPPLHPLSEAQPSQDSMKQPDRSSSQADEDTEDHRQEPPYCPTIISAKPRWRGLANSCRNIADRNGLTSRELDVCLLLARGYSQQGIADALYISQSTVKSHCYSIYRKLGVHTQQSLIELVELKDDELLEMAL